MLVSELIIYLQQLDQSSEVWIDNTVGRVDLNANQLPLVAVQTTKLLGVETALLVPKQFVFNSDMLEIL